MSTTDDLRAAARDLYVWGYPLVVMHRTRALHSFRNPLGRLNHIEHLSTPTDRTVVAPNNDTLYSSGWYDVSAGDLVIDVPPIERYWSVMVLDAYSHVAYVCRRTHGTAGASVRVTLDPRREPSRPVAGVLTAATPTVWILVRTLVEGPEDLLNARAIQRSITVTVPSAHPSHTTERLGRPNQVHTAGAGFFPELATALAIDAPAAWHPQPSRIASELLGRWRNVDNEILAAGVCDGEELISANPSAADRFRNGWGTNSVGSDFGANIIRRASTAKYALAAHHPIENRSYVAHCDASGALLDGARPLQLRFAPGQPPCDAFWSLTVYGPDMFLVHNAIDRYAIGNRTPGLVYESDGCLPLIIGGPRPRSISNWLPAPIGPYALGLRVYEGRSEVVGASWFPPHLELTTPT